MSYGPDFPEMFRHLARYVDLVIGGEDPSELPIENPIEFHLLVNSTTVSALGLELPATVTIFATELLQ
jgi:putative ABC transport system substrate-binding protein